MPRAFPFETPMDPETRARHRARLEDMRAANLAAGRKPKHVEGLLRSYIRTRGVPDVAVAVFLDGDVQLVWRT